MSVSVRLAKYGKRNAPSYRVVVTPTRSKRGGKNIEIIGNFNPSDPTTEFTIDKKRYEYWIEKGAIVSDAVKKLIDRKYKYIKYEPKQKRTEGTDKEGSEQEEQAEKTEDADAVENNEENSENEDE